MSKGEGSSEPLIPQLRGSGMTFLDDLNKSLERSAYRRPRRLKIYNEEVFAMETQ